MIEVRDPFEEATNERDGSIGDCDRESKTIGDGQKLFQDDEEILETVLKRERKEWL